MSTPGNTGPLGQPRGIGFGILLFIVTLGFYGWYWVFKTHEEIKQHTGEGLGGVLGLVVWILVGFVSAFVIPSEVGKMYKKDGREPPITGWTGLWLVPGMTYHDGMSRYDIHNDRLIAAFEELQRQETASGQWGLGGTKLPFGGELQDRFPLVGRFLDEKGEPAVSRLSPDQVATALAGGFE